MVDRFRATMPITERQKLRSSKNFQFWYGMTSSYFKSLDLYELASGKEKLDTSKPKDDQIEWRKKDALVQRTITSSVDKKLLIHLIHCKSGFEMYDKMLTIFGRNEVETDDLMEKFFKLSYNTQTGYKRYFHTLERLVSKLKLRDIAISEDVVINKVLTSLPACYEDFLSEWVNLDDKEKTFAELKKRLSGDDVWNKMISDQQNAGTGKFCFICGNPYHHPRYCLKMYANRKGRAHMENGYLSYSKFTFFQSAAARQKHAFPTIQRPRCAICKKDNHSTKSCYFRPQRASRRNGYQTGIVSLSFDDDEGEFVVTTGSRRQLRAPRDDYPDNDDDSDVDSLLMF